MNFFRGGDYQPRPGPYAHMHRAVCGQRARPAEAALARAGWTGVYRTRVILRGREGVKVACSNHDARTSIGAALPSIRQISLQY